MKLKNAVKILRRFRDWHSGKDCRTFDETGLEKREIGHAMDVILKHHGMPKPLTDCEACRNFDEMFGGCVVMHSFNPVCVFKRRKEEDE